ncbi:AI-2E family transporter [Roseicyclus marinus]|uniref:AI-2E family transporter n=1 Tax=Roseicyclus marinus TaxID=2161673 RepID=UPI00240F44C5|nr:AI-2E family transporter [Roseicyclus marinus]MDG3042794.1 AI-2E family transporter [Roseicyclus marinus]
MTDPTQSRPSTTGQTREADHKVPGRGRDRLPTALLVIIAGILTIAALDAASFIAVPAVLALLSAIALTPAVKWLGRTGAPPSLCAALVVGGILGAVASCTYLLMPSAEAMNERAPEILREIETRLRRIFAELSPPMVAPADDVSAMARPEAPTGNPDGAPAPEADSDAVSRLVEGSQNLMAGWAIGVPGVVAGAVFWAMLTFYMLRDRAMLSRACMAVFADASTRRSVARAMRDVQTNVARYLLAILMVNFGLGVCIAVAFQVLGVSNAGLWGAAGGLLNFMPFIGIALFALVTLGVGIASDAPPLLAFAPFVAVVVLNVIEGHIVTPMVVGARIQIAPIAVFATIFFGAWLWGAAGALVATPALIVAVAFMQRLSVGVRTLTEPKRPST